MPATKKRKKPAARRRSTSAEASRARAASGEEKRARRVSLAAWNPVFFGEYYVRPYDERWIGKLPRVACEQLGFAASVKRGVIITPPEFLTTTMISQLYPLWLTFRYAIAGQISKLTGMLLSEEQDLAERNLSVTAWHIEFNERLALDFCDSEGRPLIEPDPDEDKWTDSEIIVRRPSKSKDPTWQAKGLNSQGIQGARLMHLIGDDVVTPRSADSPAIQKKARRLWDMQVTTRVLEEGQALIGGNFNHPKDLLSSLAGRNSYKVYRRPSLHVKGKPDTPPADPRDEKAIVQMPERWTRERLMADLAEKAAVFPAVHLLRAASEGGEDLKAAWVKTIALSDVAKRPKWLIAIDPAPGAEVDPDPSFFALKVGALTPRHLQVVESIADRIGTTEQVELLTQKAREIMQRVHRVGGSFMGIAVSKIALDRYFRGAVEVGNPDLRPLLHEVSIGQGSKSDRISGLGPYAKSGWLQIVEEAWTEQTASQDHRDQDESLREQWVNFPTQNHDDRLDALDVLIRAARDKGGGETRVVSESDDPQADPSMTGDLLEREL